MTICTIEAQVRPVPVAPMVLPPATGPGSRTFLSPNRKFKLVVEEATLPPVSGPRSVSLNAAIVEEVGNNIVTHWAKSFEGKPVGTYSEQETIVSDDGDFFVLMDNNGGEVSLYTQNFHRGLLTATRFPGLNAGLFLTTPERLAAADSLDGQKIIRIWLRDENNWEAFRVSDGIKIPVTPQVVARWNETTRQKILDLMFADKRERLRQRVGNFSAPLAKIAGAGFRTNISRVREVYYEFLTQQRIEADRHWIEELAFSDNGANNPIGRGFPITAWPSPAAQPIFAEWDFPRLRGDWLLGIWDKKVTNGMRPLTGGFDINLPRFYLGTVSGTVRFPVPMNIYPTANSTVLHVHLIKEGAKESAEHLRGTLSPAAQWRETDIMQEASFKFGTVLPGTYRLKAVWDKRAPFANANTPGPGDYEGLLPTPIIVTAGATISNLVIDCTNRATDGEPYYRADEWLAEKWKAGKISRFTYAADSEGRVDILTRPAADWITRTNSLDPKAGIAIATIGLRTPKKVPGEELQHGNELIVALRRTTEWSRQYLRAPELIIHDEHGCPYPMKAVRDGDLITYTFWNFPRSAESWRLLVNLQKDAPADPQRTALDVTVTNLVRTASVELPIQQLPAELDLGAVKMKIAFAGLDFRSPSVAATFFVDGKETSEWQITEARVVDAHGNFIGAREMCRAERTAILIGRVGNVSRPTKTLPFEIGLAR